MLSWIFTLSEDLKYGFYDFFGSFADTMINIFDVAIAIALIVIGAWLLLKLSGRIGRRIESRIDRKNDNVNRKTTILRIFSYVARIIIIFIAACGCLYALGLGNALGSVLATAGIGGIAIGLGAQSLIKDYLSGIFITVENSFSVGDYISAAGVSGTVEDIHLRTTKLRTIDNELHIIPNGQMDVITNYSRDGVFVNVKVPIPYENKVTDVLPILESALEKLEKLYPHFIKKPEILGVEEFAESSLVISVRGMARKADYRTVERLTRACLLEELEANGIYIPYNKIVLLKDN